MKHILFIFVLLVNAFVYAQDVQTQKEKPAEEDGLPMIHAEQMPEYPGGTTALYEYLGKHLIYPAAEREAGHQGKVTLRFIVEKNGTVSLIAVMRSSGYAGLDKEAVRVVKTLSPFNPGKQNGKAVRVYFNLPVTFQLDEGKTNKDSVVLREMEGSMIKDHLKSLPDTASKPLMFAERMPEFPGGEQKMYDFLYGHIQYPEEARKNRIQGKVIIQFIVNEDGSLSDVKAIRGPGWGLNEEAVSAVKLMPSFIPGKQNGKVVKIYYQLPIIFKLN